MRLERMDLPPIQPESGELMFSGMIALRRVFWSLGAGAVCRPQMVDGLAARAFDFKVQRRSLAKQFATNSAPDLVALHFRLSFRSCPRQRAVLSKRPSLADLSRRLLADGPKSIRGPWRAWSPSAGGQQTIPPATAKFLQILVGWNNPA